VNGDPPLEPYVGLTPFEERHAAFFFGRERERRLLAASILASRLTLLYGQSGVGKSSLLRAGLVRDFREQADRALARGRLPASLLVVFGDWRDDPLPALAAAVESAVRAQLGELAPEPPPAANGLDELLLAWTRRLDEHAASLAPGRRQTPHELLLVLDQFEEYFLYHGDEGLDGTFAVEFPRAVMREDLRASFLIAIREDAYTQLDRFEGRIRNLFASNFRLEHLDERAARAAIEGPVERFNELLPDGEEPYSIEPALVDAVLQQVRAGTFALGQAGAGSLDSEGGGEIRVATPFLQLVMTRLWNEERAGGSRVLRHATLERLGGAERLVRGHLEQAMQELSPDAKALAARVFAQLVTPSGTKIVHTLPDLAAYAHASEDELAPALRTLTERRILRPVDPPPGQLSPRFEIFHDVLAPAILDWRAAHELDEQRAAEAARHRRARRRFAAISAASAGLVLVFGVLAVWALAQRRQAAEQERVARSQALAASAVSQLEADPELALLLGQAAAEEERTPEAEAAIRRGITELRLRRIVPTRSVQAASVSPDGSRVVTVGQDRKARLWRTTGAGAQLGDGVVASSFDPSGSLVVTARTDGSARIVDATTGKARTVVRAGTRPLLAARFSDDGRRVLTVGRDGAARVWDARTGVPRDEVRVPAPLQFFAFSPTDRTVLLSGSGHTQRVWMWQAGKRPLPVKVPASAVADDGRVAFAVAYALLPGVDLDAIETPLSIVDPQTRKRRTFTVRGDGGRIAFSPRGRLVAVAGASENARVYDTDSGAQIAVLRGHVDSVTDVAFSPDGETVATGSFDGSARLWRAATGEPLAVLRGPPGPTRVDFSADGRVVVTVNADGRVRTWLAQQNPTLLSKELPPAFENPRIAQIAWSPNASLLLIRSAGYAYVLDAADGRIRRTVVADAQPGGFVGFSPDGRFLASGRGILNAATGAREWRPPTQILNGAFRWDSAALAFVDFDDRIGVWRAGSDRASILGRDRDAYDVGFTLTGDVIAVGETTAFLWPAAGGARRELEHGPYAAVASGGGLAATINGRSVRLWRRDAPAERLRGHTDEVTAVAFSPDETSVATASLDGTARLWHLEDLSSIVLRGHVGSVDDVSFSPDGELLVTAGSDGTTRVWQAGTGASVAVYRIGRRGVSAAAFSPGGRLIATGGADRVVSVIDCEPCRPTDELLALARSRVTRTLTEQERRQFLGED
jgi:WD40 repeat protein